MEEIFESYRKSIQIEKEFEAIRAFEARPDDEYVTVGEVKILMQALLRFFRNKNE